MLNVTTPIERSRCCQRRSTSSTTAAASTGLVRSRPFSVPRVPLRRNVPSTRVKLTPVSYSWPGKAGNDDKRSS